MTNSADPDQFASSTLFVKAGYIWFSRPRVKIVNIKTGVGHKTVAGGEGSLKLGFTFALVL